MSRIRNLLALLQTQLWIIPALITGSAAVLAYVLLMNRAELVEGDGANVWWLYSGDASTARDLLSSLLSGLMTMTSLIVSVTFVILTLAANQLGPRLIFIFMADRQIQSVLGLFFGTILYVILVLRTLNDILGLGGVPHVAVTVASALTIACLFALLFYIQKIAGLIIADNVVEAVSRGFRSDLRQILASDAPRETGSAEIGRRTSHPIALGRRGYIQVVDYDALFAIACRDDTLLEVKVRAGHYVLERGDHVVIHSDHPLDKGVEDGIRAAFTIGSQRTPAQDLEHGIRQLVEIAMRALSPGINDPFTAIAVIDRLGAAFEEIFLRPLQPEILRDEAGEVRVLADRSHATGLVDAAFNPIRRAGAADPAILIRIADTLGKLAPAMTTDDQRAAVVGQLEKLAETTRDARLSPSDKMETLKRVEQAQATAAGERTSR